MSNVVLVTGGSQGIGRAICERLTAAGWTVFGTSRGQEGATGGGFTLIRMDVTDEASVRRGVEEVVRRAGCLNAVVNNAGLGFQGAVEDTDPAVAQRHFDVNVFGAHRVCRAALPHLRAAGGGHIVMVSSLAANFGLPFRGFYCAGKAALERMAEAMALEVKPFGIEVVVVEPGDVRTAIARRRDRADMVQAIYRERYERVMARADAQVEKAEDPMAVARLIERILRTPKPSPHQVSARGLARHAAWIRMVLPGRWFQNLLTRDQG